ncbi:hypothetical protein DSO57_1037736 [Entomophthora muscae]|uniref:Uncharacterized protein n=1 Tax=Entomophthora muscae TaxID=34485 RepID=A0ACC2U8R6_9FUNG|nr:hypothetical protein DSO57_1037736 [Entomophthora muscae]
MGLMLLFLVEILVRISVAGLEYCKDIWSLLDILVVISCMSIDIAAVVKNNVRFIRYDSLFMSFRVWYSVYMTRQTFLYEEEQEEEALLEEEKLLKDYQDRVSYLRYNHTQMEDDLVHINALICQIEQARNKQDSSDMETHSLSWHAIVPHQASLRLKGFALRKPTPVPDK